MQEGFGQDQIERGGYLDVFRIASDQVNGMAQGFYYGGVVGECFFIILFVSFFKQPGLKNLGGLNQAILVAWACRAALRQQFPDGIDRSDHGNGCSVLAGSFIAGSNGVRSHKGAHAVVHPGTSVFIFNAAQGIPYTVKACFPSVYGLYGQGKTISTTQLVPRLALVGRQSQNKLQIGPVAMEGLQGMHQQWLPL